MFADDSGEFLFDPATSSSSDVAGLDCGDITYEIWYEGDTTESTVDPSLFSIVAGTVQFTPDSSLENTEHKIYIKAIQGKYATTSANSPVFTASVGPNICT